MNGLRCEFSDIVLFGVCVQQVPTAPTVVVSERAAPDLRAENSVVSYGNGTVSIHSEGYYKSNR